jgi:hypothetical protein
MSQEEEKLIGEFEEDITPFNLVDQLYGLKLEKPIRELIHKAYRAGKLAGFEFIAKEVVSPILSCLDGIPAYKNAIEKTIQFIEEEKKKL